MISLARGWCLCWPTQVRSLGFQGRDRMPAERTTMRHVREVLRLKFVGGVPIREIARRVGVAPSTVRTTLERFQAAGLGWPLPEELTDAALEARGRSSTRQQAGAPPAGRARLGRHPTRTGRLAMPCAGRLRVLLRCASRPGSLVAKRSRSMRA